MKRLFAAWLAVAVWAVPALADGPGYRYARPAPVFSWAGYHIGIQGGYGWAGSEHLYTAPVAASGAFDVSGGFAGASWGSTWQSGALVYGFDSDFSFSSLDGSVTAAACGATSCFTDIKYFGTSRVRLGYAMDRTLIYATGGLAYASIHAGRSGLTDDGTKTRYGWTLGAGIEWALAPKWSVKLEYQHLDFGDRHIYTTAGGNPVDVNLTADIVRVGLNYKIDLPFLPRF